VEQARDFSKGSVVGVREWLLYREGNVAEAALLLPKAAKAPVPTAPIVARVRKSEYLRAILGFRTAIALGQLGRADEARQAFGEALKQLGPAPSAVNPRDLGDDYTRWYLAEAHRREAEQVFKTRGIDIDTTQPRPRAPVP
jgi:hypothetical protein